jgi:hypothetical protein
MSLEDIGVAMVELVDTSYCEYECSGFKSQWSPLYLLEIFNMFSNVLNVDRLGVL